MSRDRIVLYSGGPDSYITHYEVDRRYSKNDRVIPVYFRLQSRASEREIHAVQNTLPETAQLNSLEGLGYWEEPDSYIYQRNAFLALAATAISPSSVVYLSLQKDEFSIPDRRPEFLDSMNNLFRTLEVDSEVTSLWLDMDKTEMFEYFEGNGGRVEDLTSTWSCYDPRLLSSMKSYSIVHCGGCAACVRRYTAFVNAFGEDHTAYQDFPPDTEMAAKYVRRARLRQYSELRCQRIFKALTDGKI